MDNSSRSTQDLKKQIARLEAELLDLHQQLKQAEDRESREHGPNGVLPEKPWKWPLRAEEYERYSRQLILPSVGIKAQLHLRSASILIIGAGGLGCPAAAYLAGAGVGTIGVVDGDTVEASNLHRQIAHSTSRVSISKVDSLIAYLRDLNPLPTYIPHRTHLTPLNAADIISPYDLVLDCTDHPTSRYLISDACVLLRKPLVSASALRTDGQLIVLNSPAAAPGDPTGGPCYRCIFPKPPPPESVTSCGEGGILGPVVGVMGVLQALEALRLIAAGRHLASSNLEGEGGRGPSMLLFSAGDGSLGFRSLRMRGRRKGCFACSEEASLTLDMLTAGSLDYVQFCGGVAGGVDVLKPEERISATELSRLSTGGGHLLLDVREKEFFELGSIDGAVNVPFSRIHAEQRRADGDDRDAEPDWWPGGLERDAPIYVVCRVGNDSQLVARKLKDLGLDRGGNRFIGDVKGGMQAWKRDVDDTIPFT